MKVPSCLAFSVTSAIASVSFSFPPHHVAAGRAYGFLCFVVLCFVLFVLYLMPFIVPFRVAPHGHTGSISVDGGPHLPNRGVIAMFAQLFPGRPSSGSDSKEMRLEYFKQCLAEIASGFFDGKAWILFAEAVVVRCPHLLKLDL